MQCLSILFSKSMSRWVNQCQKRKYILNLAKTIVTLPSVLCIHMMAMRFPFLPFHVSPLVGLLFLVSSTSLLLIRLCSGQAKSDESATSTIQRYIKQNSSLLCGTIKPGFIQQEAEDRTDLVTNTCNGIQSCWVPFENSTWTCCSHQCLLWQNWAVPPLLYLRENMDQWKAYLCQKAILKCFIDSSRKSESWEVHLYVKVLTECYLDKHSKLN